MSHWPKTEGFTERFLHEGRLIAGLSHPNILTTYDLGICKDTGIPFLATEYIATGDLTQRIAEGLDQHSALDIARQIALALDYAHDNGVIHRDIKPANILFRADGTPLLSDFGIAKQLDNDQGLTSTGMVMGTPYYMSPEQAQDLPLDGRSDLYSLGVLLYEMLTGEQPYVAATAISTALKHVQAPVPELPKAHRSVQPIINRLMAKDPSDRYSRGQNVASSISKLLQGEPISNAPGDSIALPRIKKSLLQRYKVLEVLIFSTLIALVLVVTLRKEPTQQAPVPVSTAATEPTVSDQPLNEDYFTLTDEDLSQPVTSPEIQQLLNSAKQRLAQQQLVKPETDSALYFYSQVLKRDPKNERALAGFNRIADAFVQQVEQHLQNNELNSAQEKLKLGLSVAPNYEPLMVLEQVLADKLK